jgi:hypothetical protein
MGRTLNVPKRLSSWVSTYLKHLWLVAWSLANIGWSIPCVYEKVPAGEYLFPGYLFLSLYVWIRWYWIDINKMILLQEVK